MKIIGLDVGEKRIGVAKVDSGTRIALPVGFVLVDGSEWQEIARIAKLNNTNFFVLGLPRSNEGNETAQTLYVRNFARTLAEKVPGAKIRFQDESLTSVEAENRLKSRKRKYEKGEIDAEAASIILQDFVESNTLTSTRKERSPDSRSSSVATAVRSNVNDKVKLNAKKINKWKIFGIPVIVLALILGGITVALKIRDNILEEREKYFAELEAQMKPDVFNFTIVPGDTIFDVKKKLLAHGYTPEAIDEGLGSNFSNAFLQDRPEGATLEGYLAPETHEFYSDASVRDILAKFIDGMEAVIVENGLEEKFAAQGLSLYQGITLASVVQKEAPTAEMPTVAQVFLTRISRGIQLGSDVTVSYALDLVDPERNIYTDNAAALEMDSCYNTRKHAGLPCGPISNPGLAALLAVANPSDTGYLYFLTGDDGVMYYSYSESEHLQNAAEHCQTLCNVSL